MIGNKEKRFHFNMTDLEPGASLRLDKENTINCEVHDKKSKIYRYKYFFV